MRPSTLVCFTSALLLTHGGRALGEICETRTQWGEDACSLGGSLRVESVSKKMEVTAQKCNPFFNKTEFQKQPMVSLADAKSGDTYAVVMVDPDAPKLPKGKYYLHWIVTDIPGEDLKNGDLKKGKTVTAYKGPSPPDGSGTHRYQFLVLRQPTGARVAEVPDSQRARFDLGAWMAKYSLCGPLAGLQFRTNYSGDAKAQ